MYVSEVEFTPSLKEVAHLTLIPHFTGLFNKKFIFFFIYCQEADEEKIATVTSTDFSLRRKRKAEYPLLVTANINWGKNKSFKSCK